MQYTINTIDELYEFIGREDFGNITSLKFGKSLSTLSIKFKGDNYHSSLTTNAMDGLVDLQKAIHRSAAQILYGFDNATRLTEKNKESLLITFKIAEGSSDTTADLGKVFDAITEGIKNMESKDIMRTLCFVAFCYLGYQTYSIHAEKASQIEIERIKLDHEKEHTKQMELLIQKIPQIKLNKVKENIDLGFRQVIQGASDADEITIANNTFDKEAIALLSERAKRKPTNSDLLESAFRINSINTASADLLKFYLSKQDDEVEFQASLESGEFNADEKALLWNAAINRQAINLKVNVAMSGDAIKHGSIVYIGDLKEPA